MDRKPEEGAQKILQDVRTVLSGETEEGVKESNCRGRPQKSIKDLDKDLIKR